MYTLYITNCRLVKIDNRKYIHDEDTSHTHKNKCLSVTNNVYCTHTYKHTKKHIWITWSPCMKWPMCCHWIPSSVFRIHNGLISMTYTINVVWFMNGLPRLWRHLLTNWLSQCIYNSHCFWDAYLICVTDKCLLLATLVETL